MKNNKKNIVIIAIASMVCTINAMAAGMFLDRIATKGDILNVEAEIKNLTDVNDKEISLNPLYTPKRYKLRFECGEGEFTDGQKGYLTEVVYNDGGKIYNGNPDSPELIDNTEYIIKPNAPVREGYDFIGWYLKGNRTPEINQTSGDGEIIGEKCKYNIANDDEEDLSRTEHGSDGITIAKALWRKNNNTLPGGSDGNGPDNVDKENTGGWNELNKANQVIEYIEKYQDKEAYKKSFGDIDYSYRRLLLNAETEHANSYKWSVKKRGTESFTDIDHAGAVYKADKLTRADNGDIYRCEVGFGDNGTKIMYEMPVKVWYLAEITDIEIFADGQRLEIISESGGAV
ncbi:MAG: InlB B-repeat-containing protein [Eubacteriales bacterium]|nr:InlB B-repeat-containing protein [Eubacteriales bacterium]